MEKEAFVQRPEGRNILSQQRIGRRRVELKCSARRGVASHEARVCRGIVTKVHIAQLLGLVQGIYIYNGKPRPGIASSV